MNNPVIICVDDEKTILDSIKEQLIDSFTDEYSIEVASDGEEALELFNELLEEHREIPLVISDYMMPNIKGDDLLKRIHAISPKTRKIMLTGQASVEGVSNAVNYAKLYRYIAKPWYKEDLILTVSEAIKSYLKDMELEKKITTFYKFVPAQFIKNLNIQNYEYIELGSCVERNMTIMFSDIRSFTTLSENMAPQEIFNFLNNYLSQMEPVIERHNGFIDKYIGDAIMALFPNVDDAMRGSIAMLKTLTKYNEIRQQAGYCKPIKIGIGLNTGPLILGTIGGKNRMDSTVISDAVNLASRVENLTKTYNTPLLITEQTCKSLDNISEYKIKPIGHVNVKGKTETVMIYEVLY